jgi:DivIVA domain-containing protein
MSLRFWKLSTAAKVVPAIDGAQLRAAGGALRRTKLREGYDINQVDELLERASVALDEHHRAAALSLTPEAVLKVKFKASKFQDGYDQDEVDDLLDRVIASLRA